MKSWGPIYGRFAPGPTNSLGGPWGVCLVNSTHLYIYSTHASKNAQLITNAVSTSQPVISMCFVDADNLLQLRLWQNGLVTSCSNYMQLCYRIYSNPVATCNSVTSLLYKSLLQIRLKLFDKMWIFYSVVNMCIFFRFKNSIGDGCTILLTYQ